MTRWEQEAIRLKYLGKTYRQIANEISKYANVSVSESTIKQWFMVDGRLYIPYLTYSAKLNEQSEDEIRKELKRDAENGVKVLRSLLQKAIKNGEFQVALNIIKEQMDRGGVVTVRKSEINVKDQPGKEMTREDYIKECARLGIDPRSGLRVPTAQTKPN